jgi:hypothetical protein
MRLPELPARDEDEQMMLEMDVPFRWVGAPVLEAR